MNAALQQREEVRRHLRAELHKNSLQKAAKMTGKNLRNVRKAAVLSIVWNFAANPKHTHEKETRPASRNI